MVIFCKQVNVNCEYLSEDNNCSKITNCLHSTENSCILIPENCEHYGTLFLKLEEIKQKVRKYKEEIIYYEAMINSGCKDEKIYQKIIDSLNRFIDKYATFGSENW